ncbi:hypothetical protein ACFL54_01040 [Planctomycetota bacterium]
MKTHRLEYCILAVIILAFSLTGCSLICSHHNIRTVSAIEPAPHPESRVMRHIGYSKWQAHRSEKSFFENVKETEFYVIRDEESLNKLRKHLGREKLFAGKVKVNFSKHMIVGAIGEPDKKARHFRVHRLSELPDVIKIGITDYRRRPVEKTITPVILHRIKRIDKPVDFYYNGYLAKHESPPPETSGLIRETFNFDYNYAIYVPENLTKPAPLLIYMHGSSSNGPGTLVKGKYHELADEFGFILLFPSAAIGYYWDHNQDYGCFRHIIQSVMSRFPVDANRVFIGGYSAGGHTIYHFALTHPEFFRGYFSLAGRLNPSYIFDGHLKAAKDMLFYIVCGIDDTTVPVQYVVKGKDRLVNAGANVHFKAVPGGHGAPQGGKERRKLFEWIRDLPDDNGKNKPWPEDPAALLNHLNTWDSQQFDILEHPVEHKDKKPSDKTTEWVAGHKEKLADLGTEIIWDRKKQLYLIPAKVEKK